MTDSQRELAEYVARWAGYTLAPNGLWDHPHETGRYGQSFLFDPALAWQAQEELIEEVGYRKAMHEVHAYVCGQGCTRIEATHRALRAARGGE